MYILIADDDEDDKDLIREAIPDIENTLIEDVDNGMALYQKLIEIENLPHFIFLDLNMPKMGGKECLVKIRANVKLKELPIIIYSTSCAEKDIEETYKLGANLYVIKPNTFSEIKIILAKIVSINWLDHAPFMEKNKFVFKCD